MVAMYFKISIYYAGDYKVQIMMFAFRPFVAETPVRMKSRLAEVPVAEGCVGPTILVAPVFDVVVRWRDIVINCPGVIAKVAVGVQVVPSLRGAETQVVLAGTGFVVTPGTHQAFAPVGGVVGA
jgi:hypothetical protein